MTLPPILSNIPFLKVPGSGPQKTPAPVQQKIQDFPSDRIEVSAAAVEKQRVEAEVRSTVASVRQELESSDLSLGLDPEKMAG